MSRFFETELAELRSKLTLMGELAIENTKEAIASVVTQDSSLASTIIEKDDKIDELELEIDSDAVRYISLRAPVAKDVRLLTIAMKACHSLERVGDEASSIAKRSKKLSDNLPLKEYLNIPKMSELAVGLLRESLDSLINQDSDHARTIPPKDKAIDKLHRENHRKFSEMIEEQPEHASSIVELMFISKSIERIADHATNIAEEVVYLVSGEDVRHTDEVKRI